MNRIHSPITVTRAVTAVFTHGSPADIVEALLADLVAEALAEITGSIEPRITRSIEWAEDGSDDDAMGKVYEHTHPVTATGRSINHHVMLLDKDRLLISVTATATPAHGDPSHGRLLSAEWRRPL